MNERQVAETVDSIIVMIRKQLDAPLFTELLHTVDLLLSRVPNEPIYMVVGNPPQSVLMVAKQVHTGSKPL
tara:strand:+ start:345 stop:557 length:213 start_codon:yes stop_codon:yes gene_type:complete